MAETDVINLDPLILQRLQNASAQSGAGAAIPTPQAQPQMGSSFYDLYGAQQGETISPEDEFLMQATPKSTGQLAAEAGILNEGVPTDLRFQLSTTTLFNEDLQKKNVEFNLQRYFKEKGNITDDYDFGVRVGPVSNRLEFRDPRFEGKYNVLDPFGFDIVGDIADISADTLLPIATEVTAGVGTALIPGVGQVPGAPIAAASLAATATSFGRLMYARNSGYLSPDVTDEDIAFQALKEGGLSAAFGIGGQALFKMAKPVLRAMGLANPKFAFDIDEQTFIRAYERYMATPAGKKAAETGVMPSSAQILEQASKDESIGAAERAVFQASASELAGQEAKIATSPSRDIAEGVLTPSRERAIAAETAVRGAAETGMPAGVRGTAQAMGETEAQRLGQGVQQQMAIRSETLAAQTEASTSRELANIEAAIDDAVNLPANVADATNVGRAAQDAIAQSYENASQTIGRQYEDLFKRWSDSTGISIDSVVPGKGAIKPSEAVNFALDIKRTLPDRPFASPEDSRVINKVIDSFVESQKGAAVKVKPVSLRTLNENIRDLRRLERKAYNAAQRGEDAPSPETISGMVDALEAARSRIISRKDAPAGLADELKVLDDQFAQFSKKFRNTQVSAVAKLRSAKNPEAAWNLLFQKDSRGKTAVLDIADELKSPHNADLYSDVGSAIRKKWLDTVVKRNAKGEITKVDVAAHNRFLNEYEAVMDSYLSQAERNSLGSATNFAEQVLQIQARKKAVLNDINKRFELGGGKELEPELIFQRTWKEGRISRFDEVYNALRQSPELMDTFKAFVYKDMFDPSKGRVKNFNGRDVIDPAQLKEYVDGNKDKLRTLFGGDYVNNLRTVIDVAEAALTEVPVRGARQEGNALTGIIRGYVGMFTRPGRFLTFMNRQRGRMKEDAMTTALSNPKVLADMAKASRVSPLSNEGLKLAGRILLGRYDYPTDRGLPVDQPSNARAILQEIEAGNR